MERAPEIDRPEEEEKEDREHERKLDQRLATLALTDTFPTDMDAHTIC